MQYHSRISGCDTITERERAIGRKDSRTPSNSLLGFDGGKVPAVWARIADPSIKLSRYISNRKIYDKGSACAQNAYRYREF